MTDSVSDRRQVGLSTSLRDAVVGLIPAAVLVVLGLLVTVQVLEAKFDIQEVRANERYGILKDIQANALATTLSLNNLTNTYDSMNNRVKIIEQYVPSSIVVLEKDVVAMQKDYDLLAYRLTNHIEDATP